MDSYRNYGCGGCRNMNYRPPKPPCQPVGKVPGCETEHHHHKPLGMGYVPMQKWGEMYDPQKALCQGTAFPDLDFIFCGIRGQGV